MPEAFTGLPLETHVVTSLWFREQDRPGMTVKTVKTLINSDIQTGIDWHFWHFDKTVDFSIFIQNSGILAISVHTRSNPRYTI